MFDILKLDYYIFRVGLFICFHLSCMVFSELPGYIILCLTLIWKNSQSLLIQTLLMFLPWFLLPLVFPLHACYTFCSCPTVLGHSVVGFFCVFSLFVLGQLSVVVSSDPEIHSSAMSRPTELIKDTLHFCYNVFDL